MLQSPVARKPTRTRPWRPAPSVTSVRGASVPSPARAAPAALQPPFPAPALRGLASSLPDRRSCSFYLLLVPADRPRQPTQGAGVSSIPVAVPEQVGVGCGRRCGDRRRGEPGPQRRGPGGGGQGCGGRNGVSFTSPSSRGSRSPPLSVPNGGGGPPLETTRYRRSRLIATWGA